MLKPSAVAEELTEKVRNASQSMVRTVFRAGDPIPPPRLKRMAMSDRALSGGEGAAVKLVVSVTGLEVPPPSRLPRILLLEDESAIRGLVSAMLKIRRLNADEAGTVAEARRLMEQRQYDIVLVDVNLPDGSGLSPVEESSGEPLVIVMTGSTDIQTAVRAIRDGAFDFITKPFFVGHFLRRIDKAIEEWKTRERAMT